MTNQKQAMSGHHGIEEQELADVRFSPERRDGSVHLGFHRTHGHERRPAA